MKTIFHVDALYNFLIAMLRIQYSFIKKIHKVLNVEKQISISHRIKSIKIINFEGAII